jgi:hypothetical protein
MRKMMRRLVIIICLIAGFLFVPGMAARAQGSVEFDSMEIDIWPEYDRPEVLVIYKITLASQTTMPAQISLRMPKSAIQPPNVAMQDVDGLLYNLNFTTAADGDYIKVNFTAPSSKLQFEYYDPSLTKNGEDRSFQFHWTGDYTVHNMLFVVQQPLHATQMTILPSQGVASNGPDNLTYYGNTIGTVQAGASFTYKISYNNPDGLTVPSGSVQPSNPIPTPTPGFPQIPTLLVIAVLGVILIAGGLGWFFWQRQPRPAGPTQRRHTPARVVPFNAQEGPRHSQTHIIYCHQCGKRAAPGDIYCRVCGTRLRTG